MLEYAIKNYIDNITGLYSSPSFSTGPYPAITYRITPINDGAVKQSQVEIRVIAGSLEECLPIREKIIEGFQTNLSDRSIVDGDIVMRCEVSGGGWLFNSDLQMWEYPTLFITKWRKING